MTNTYAAIDNTLQVRDILESKIENSIIHGSNTNEFKLEFNSLSTPDLSFVRNMVRTDQNTSSDFFDQTSTYRNQTPGFRNITDRDFHLTSGAFPVDKGQAGADVDAVNDLDGVTRVDGLPDLGCYEYVP